MSSLVAHRAIRNRGLAVAIGIVAIGYACLVARTVLHVQNDFGQANIVSLGIVTFFPLGAFLAFRYPLIFPFGAYVALVPFDSILALSSGATLTRYVAILTALALVFRAILLREVMRPARSWFAWFVFILYAGVSLLWTPDTATAQTVYQAMVQLFVLLTVFGIYPARPTELRIALALIVATGVGAGLYGLYLYHAGNMINLENRIVLATSSGIALDPNYFSTSFLLPIAIALATAFYSRSWPLRFVCTCTVLVMMGGMLVSGSRGGFLAVAAVFGYFVLRSKNRFQVGAIMAASLGLTAFFPSVFNRFLNDPSEAGSGSGRTYIWKTGLATIREHWLFGAGVGSFSSTYSRSLLEAGQTHFQGWSRPSHSIIVGSLTEYGIVGLALVLGCWYLTFRQTRAIARTSWLYGMRLASEAALVGLFLQAMFIDPFEIKYYWLAFSLPLMLINVARPGDLTTHE